ncbi:MAG: HesA/MoeB/ThiF family protein [Deinococcales bacterium]
MSFTREQLKRYSRQVLLPEIGLNGVEKLRDSSVLVVGAGGLGSPVLTYLVSSGVGRIRIAEFDTLELSNLQRQFLYDSHGIGQPKLELALERLSAQNPEVRLEPVGKFTASNAEDAIGASQLVLDCSDTIQTRHLVSDFCSSLKKYHVWGAAEGFTGMSAVFGWQHTLRQAFPDATPRDDCNTIGVLAPLLGVIGSLMATNALKLLLGLEVRISELVLFDALDSGFRTIKLK